MGEEAKRSKARCHLDLAGVYVAGMWGEGHASYPGRSVYLPKWLVLPRDRAMGMQKSAEAIVVVLQNGEGPNTCDHFGAERSMSKKGADKRSEMAKLSVKVGDGIAEDIGAERQTLTACKGNAETEETVTIEEVLQRDNMVRAYQRVVRNGGAPGVDGVTVDDLMDYSRKHWSRISREITEGKYIPSAVRKVEIRFPSRKRCA